MSDFDEHEFELTGTGVKLRTAGPDDQDLVRRIVAMAANWRLTDVPHQLTPDIDKYYVDWGRPGDIGVFVFSGIEFAGGAYVRRFDRADRAYGYIATSAADGPGTGSVDTGSVDTGSIDTGSIDTGSIDTAYPELTIGVEAGFRRRGLAVLLLAALKAKVLEQGLTGISLSVEPDNHARHLYRRMGFDLVEDRGNDLLMLWRR